MCHNTDCFWLVVPGGKCTFISNKKHFPDLQSSTTVLRKTVVTMSNFKIKLLKAMKTTTTLSPRKNTILKSVVHIQNANSETKGWAIARLRNAFLVNIIVIASTGPLAEIAVGLAQSVKYLTAGEVAGWIPGTRLNLSVLIKTNWEVKAQNECFGGVGVVVGGGGYRQKMLF